MQRTRNKLRLKEENFDVLIIGGGAVGLGCALDAQLRGLKVALIEQDDFGSGTSSRSTKLIHGGLRYLETSLKHISFHQLKFVFDSLNERGIILQNNPHLAKSIPFTIPSYSPLDSMYYLMGVKIYDRLAGKQNLSRSRWISKREALNMIPDLKKDSLQGAIIYWDGQFNDVRYAIALARTADALGAVIANHLRLLGFNKVNGRLVSAVASDGLSSEIIEIKAKAFINAAGPAGDLIRKKADPRSEPKLRVSKGVHLVFPRDALSSKTALVIPRTDDKRLLFAIPWLNCVLVGTTDNEVTTVDAEPLITKDDIDYLLNNMNRYLRHHLLSGQIQSAFAGTRSLLNTNSGTSSKSLSRDHEIEVEGKWLISILGGKWTTYRMMAEDTVNVLCRVLKFPAAPGRTRQFPLWGSGKYRPSEGKIQEAGYLPEEEVCQRYSQTYGAEADSVGRIAAENRNLALPIIPGCPFSGAEVVHAVRNEMAQTIKDVLLNRLPLELMDIRQAYAAAPAVVRLIAMEMKWTDAQISYALRDYQARLNIRIRQIYEN